MSWLLHFLSVYNIQLCKNVMYIAFFIKFVVQCFSYQFVVCDASMFYAAPILSYIMEEIASV